MHQPGLKPLYAKKGKADESVFPFLCYDRMLTVSDSLGELLGELLIHRHVLPVEHEALHAQSGGTGGVGVVHRHGRHVLEQDPLGLLVQLVGLVGVRGGGGLSDQRVELRVGVVAVVGALAVGASVVYSGCR